jgi:hypothetical protein
MDATPTAPEGRAAHREQFFRAQIDGVETRPFANTMADCEIDIFAGEIDVVHRRRYPKIDLWVRIRESGEVLMVITPERCRDTSRSVPSAIRSNASRTTDR